MPKPITNINEVPIIEKESIVDLLAMPDTANINLEPPKLNKKICRPENFDF